MTLLQTLNAFRVYSADALILALGVTLCCSLLKKTVLKKCPKKIYVFLPFVLGFVFYAAFRAIVTMSAAPFTSGLTETFEGGFACGCAATLYYVVYKQFFRPNASAEPPALLPVTPLLQGLVPEERVEEAAKALTEGYKDKAEGDRFDFVLETLRAFAAAENGALTEGELYLHAKTVSLFLSAVTQ